MNASMLTKEEELKQLRVDRRHLAEHMGGSADEKSAAFGQGLMLIGHGSEVGSLSSL